MADRTSSSPIGIAIKLPTPTPPPPPPPHTHTHTHINLYFQAPKWKRTLGTQDAPAARSLQRYESPVLGFKTPSGENASHHLPTLPPSFAPIPPSRPWTHLHGVVTKLNFDRERGPVCGILHGHCEIRHGSCSSCVCRRCQKNCVWCVWGQIQKRNCNSSWGTRRCCSACRGKSRPRHCGVGYFWQRYSGVLHCWAQIASIDNTRDVSR